MQKIEPRTVQLVTINEDGTIGEHLTKWSHLEADTFTRARITARHEANQSGKDVAILVCFAGSSPITTEIVRH